MSVKRVWNGLVASVFDGLHYKYNQDKGGKYEGVAPRVFLLVKVSEGREAGRLVRVTMTPEEAERQAATLLGAAKKTRESGFVERTELG